MKQNKRDNLSSQITDVLAYQSKKSRAIELESAALVKDLADYERLLLEQGITLDADLAEEPDGGLATISSFEDCVRIARDEVGSGHSRKELLTDEELAAADERVRRLNDEYNSLHRLDSIDIAISVSAGLVSSVVDILLVGIPERTTEGLRGRPLENYVRDWFTRQFPPEEMERLAKDVSSKVPYDAPYNKGFTEEYVEGLWPTMHRLYSLGHDPLLGFVVGTLDILSGRMTTIDKLGRIVSQAMPRYAGREETAVFAALCKQVIHLKSDMTTSMGLPAPLMGLFNLMQFGSIGEEEQTIAEIVQGMYYEGYDFQHFCAQSIPVMLTEVIVRLGYFLKRTKEGHSAVRSLPITTNRKQRPKLGTMLFTAHSIATAVNAGRIAFTKNPIAINYPQWIFFAYRSFAQAKWLLIDKPGKRHEYVMQALEADIASLALPEAMEVIVLGDDKPKVQRLEN